MHCEDGTLMGVASCVRIKLDFLAIFLAPNPAPSLAAGGAVGRSLASGGEHGLRRLCALRTACPDGL